MKYFGLLNPEIIKNLSNANIADFLIQNKLFTHATKKKYVFKDDFEVIDIEDKNTIIKSSKIFILTLHEILKLISANMYNQFKKDSHQILNLGEKCKIDLKTFFENEVKNLNLEPTQNLLDDFYETMINQFSSNILDNKFLFYENFNQQIFGLNFVEKKQIALKHYKDIYKSLFDDNVIYLCDDYVDEYEPEIDFLKSVNKLKMIYSNKLKYQHKLIATKGVFKYLIGDKSVFRETFYNENHKIIEEVIVYEATKEVMIELNNKFEFEDDFYFTNDMEEKRKFHEYRKLFNSFKEYKFTDITIRKFDSDIKAKVESLYEFLRVNNLVNKGKIDFLKFLEIEYNIILTKIISYINYDNRRDFPKGGKISNEAHIKRVEILEENWALFIDKNK